MQQVQNRSGRGGSRYPEKRNDSAYRYRQSRYREPARYDRAPRRPERKKAGRPFRRGVVFLLLALVLVAACTGGLFYFLNREERRTCR